VSGFDKGKRWPFLPAVADRMPFPSGPTTRFPDNALVNEHDGGRAALSARWPSVAKQGQTGGIAVACSIPKSDLASPLPPQYLRPPF